MADNAGAGDRDRDPINEQRERDAFLLLLHICNLAEADPDRPLPWSGVARDLAFEPSSVEAVGRFLLTAGYVQCPATGQVLITPNGIDYVERQARNRRSVRYSRTSSEGRSDSASGYWPPFARREKRGQTAG